MSEPTFAHRRIRGTYGGLDYTVVAKNGPVILGLKLIETAVFDTRKGVQRLVPMLRVRSTFDPDLPVPTNNPEEAAQLVQEAWPGLKFQIVGDTNYGFRARFHAGLPLFKTVSERDVAVSALDKARFYAKVYAFLAEGVLDPGEFTLAFEDFREALREQAMALFGATDLVEADDGSESGVSFVYQEELNDHVNGPESPFDDGEDLDEAEPEAEEEPEEIQVHAAQSE